MNTMLLIIMAIIKMLTPFIGTLIIMIILHGIIFQATGYSIYNELEKKLIK